MRDFKQAEMEAREILDDQYDLTVEEMKALHDMDGWSRITAAFCLGIVSGAKSAAEKEPELVKALQTLPEDKLMEIRNHAEQILMESAADRFKVCGCCGSENLTRKDRVVICEDCGAAGGVKIDSRGRVRLFWNYEGKYDR